MHANKREEIKDVFAGDIAAAVGLRNVTTGDTMYSRRVLTLTVDAMDGTGPHTWTYTYGGTPHEGPFPFTNTVTDPLGNYTQYAYDNAGELTSVTAPDPD